jgi:peptidyl-prolyl cis-trans isomerase B (cyclophilin B)
MHLRKSARLALLAGLVIVAVAVLTGCAQTPSGTANQSSTTTSDASNSSTNEPSTTDPSASTPEEPTVYTPLYKLSGDEIAVIKTSKGTIKVKFYEKDAPVAAANFIELAQKGYYDEVKFHRYVPGFVIQGGDPQTKTAASADVAAADGSGTGRFGTGGPGYKILDEYAGNPNKHVDGSLAMARTGAPNSGGSQFYFALGALPNLDGQYTVFGQATSGLEVIHNLRAGDVIESVTIENASK